MCWCEDINDCEIQLLLRITTEVTLTETFSETHAARRPVSNGVLHISRMTTYVNTFIPHFVSE